MSARAAALPLARIGIRPDVRDPDAWYWRLPAVAQLRSEGIEPGPVTVLVGENGGGKSTLVYAVAEFCRKSLTASVKHWGPVPSAEDAGLWQEVTLAGPCDRPQGGVWPRGEAMHGLFTGLDRAAIELRAFDGVPLNERSHGEGFLALLESRTTERGLGISTSRSRRCPSGPRSDCWRCCTASPLPARRCCWRRTRPCWPPSPARRRTSSPTAA